jgi:hypothetical protein
MSLTSGIVHFGQQKAEMSHLYYKRKDTDDGPVLALVFSDHALPLRALDDQQKLVTLARKRGLVGLYLELDDKGSVHHTELLHDDGAFSGSWTFKPKDSKKPVLAGRIGTEGEKTFFDNLYNVDVTYELAQSPDQSWRGSPFYEAKATGLPLGQAKGAMELHGKKTELFHAVAVKETDLFGESGEQKLFFTTAPIPAEVLNGAMGLESGLQKAGSVYLRLTIDDRGEIQSVMLPGEDGASVSFSSTEWSLELTPASGSDVDGHAELARSADGNPDFPQFDLRFHAPTKKVGAAEPVTAENGKSLPNDGGEPGRAYRAFGEALKKAKTIDELLPLRLASLNALLNDIPAEHRSSILEMFKQQGAVPTKIVGGFANDTQATLWTESIQGTETVEGRVNLQRESGGWKLGQEAFRNRPARSE